MAIRQTISEYVGRFDGTCIADGLRSAGPNITSAEVCRALRRMRVAHELRVVERGGAGLATDTKKPKISSRPALRPAEEADHQTVASTPYPPLGIVRFEAFVINCEAQRKGGLVVRDQQYRVCVPIRGVDAREGKGIITIPDGATVTVIAYPDGDKLITVRWKNRDVMIFRQDLSRRAVIHKPDSR